MTVEVRPGSVAICDGDASASARSPAERIEARTAVAGILGLGYVGLPLAVEIGNVGYTTLGFDVSAGFVARLNTSESHIQDVSSSRFAALVQRGVFSATTDMPRLVECDVVSICVPNPLNQIKDPGLSYMVSAAIRCVAVSS